MVWGCKENRVNMKISQITGKVSKTRRETIKTNLEINKLDRNMIYDRALLVSFDSCSEPHLMT